MKVQLMEVQSVHKNYVETTTLDSEVRTYKPVTISARVELFIPAIQDIHHADVQLSRKEMEMFYELCHEIEGRLQKEFEQQ